MDDTTFLILLSMGTTLFLLIILLLINIRWISFGTEIMFKRFLYKGNMGLLWTRNKSGNFTLPKVINLAEKSVKLKQGKDTATFPIDRTQYSDSTRFFGMPSALFDAEDCKTSLGIVYHQTDEQGNPLYWNEDIGFPKYVGRKNSVSLSPTLLEAIIEEKSLTNALRKFLDNNKILFYLCLGAIIAGGIGAYFGYELISNQIPLLQSSIETGFQQMTNKLDLILEAVR